LNFDSPIMVLKFFHIPEAELYKSEPPPEWFGNGPNETDRQWTNENWLKSRFHFSFAGEASRTSLMERLHRQCHTPHVQNTATPRTRASAACA
jgi:hypothetical protein